jgi:hypothetical protein
MRSDYRPLRGIWSRELPIGWQSLRSLFAVPLSRIPGTRQKPADYLGWNGCKALEPQTPLPVVDASQLFRHVFHRLGSHDVKSDVVLLRSQAEEAAAAVVIAKHAITDSFFSGRRRLTDQATQVLYQRQLLNGNCLEILFRRTNMSLHGIDPDTSSEMIAAGLGGTLASGIIRL